MSNNQHIFNEFLNAINLLTISLNIYHFFIETIVVINLSPIFLVLFI